MPLTREQVLSNLDYYGLTGEDAQACADEWLARQAEGMAPDLSEYAEAWLAL